MIGFLTVLKRLDRSRHGPSMRLPVVAEILRSNPVGHRQDREAGSRRAAPTERLSSRYQYTGQHPRAIPVVLQLGFVIFAIDAQPYQGFAFEIPGSAHPSNL